MRILFAIILGFVAGTAIAGSFDKGDPKIGKPLLEKSCSPCHATQFGGDGSKVYTRANRIVHTPEQLLARIRVCNTNSNAGWFPDEEMHVAAYLNLTEYHFK
ncbi:MAG: cytochrome c [Sulfuricella sp.]|nr:cytochrome c [Sulfuricella sp.]